MAHSSVFIDRSPSPGTTTPLVCFIFYRPLLSSNDTVDIISLLFSKHRDFLITNDAARPRVRAHDLRGKTILVYMLALDLNHNHRIQHGVLVETFHLIETYNELWPEGGFEVVFVPIMRGGDASYAQERFHLMLSDMPWPAVPLSDRLTCGRIERIFQPTLSQYWVVVDPRGKVSLIGNSGLARFFNYCGGPDLPLSIPELRSLLDQDRAIIDDAINLNQLLATPCRDFLLAKDGNKVPINYLKDKVVGLYFCDYDSPSPERLEAITKVYHETLDRGYDFEMVQINFHFLNKCKQSYYMKHLPSKPLCENMPWLTMPFKDSCCRRLRRIFRLYKGDWPGDRLLIINPHEPNLDGTFYDIHGATVMQHFGIEAYPFTRDMVFQLERARRQRELRLQNILNPAGPPLLRHRGGGSWDQKYPSRNSGGRGS